jgi:hypothetical protein
VTRVRGPETPPDANREGQHGRINKFTGAATPAV